MELAESGTIVTVAAGGTEGFTAASVLDLVRLVKQNFKVARMPGTPVIVLDSNGAAEGAVEQYPQKVRDQSVRRGWVALGYLSE